MPPLPPLPLLLVAAVALTDRDGRVLLARRPEGKHLAGYWEFPGGKIEAGETPEGTIIRELREELGIEICPTCLAPYTFASHRYETFHLLMPLFLCSTWEGEVTPREKQEIRWVRASRLSEFAITPAGTAVVPYLRDLLG